MSKLLSVYYHGHSKPLFIGRLSYQKGLAYFEYDPQFLHYNLNLSPFKLAQNNSLQVAARDPFNGLHGIFND